MSGGPFRRRVVIGLALLGAASLLSAILFGILGEPKPPVTAQANSFSRSAIGHQAWVTLLRRVEVPVLVSRFRSGERAGNSGLLVVLEPYLEDTTDDDVKPLADMVGRASASLVVLPKRYGEPADDNEAHIGSAGLHDTEDVGFVLTALGIDGAVVRADAATVSWSTDGLTGKPDVDDLQLIDAVGVSPIIDSDAGVLLGAFETDRGRIYVLSDPDIIATHGLVRGNNAKLSIAIANHVRQGRAMVIDETLHGFTLRPSLSREMLRFPLILVVLQGIVIMLAVLWAGLGRFGAPKQPRRVLSGGPLEVLDNTAQVMSHGAHAAHALSRYLQMTVREVALALHAPSLRGQQRLDEWLDAMGRSRRVSVNLGVLRERAHQLLLENKVPPREAVLLALRIDLWKREILNGSQRHLPTAGSGS